MKVSPRCTPDTWLRTGSQVRILIVDPKRVIGRINRCTTVISPTLTAAIVKIQAHVYGQRTRDGTFGITRCPAYHVSSGVKVRSGSRKAKRCHTRLIDSDGTKKGIGIGGNIFSTNFTLIFHRHGVRVDANPIGSGLIHVGSLW